MKNIFLALVFLCTVNLHAKDYKVFHTSLCYDLLSSFANYEELITHPFFENSLAKDTLFISDIKLINEKVRPSNICNFYASLPTDKDSLNACLSFFSTIHPTNIPEKWRGKYVDNIYEYPLFRPK